jgi:hypothetical protein
LLLDEIYAVEWKGGRWQFKKSFGTALKFWGDDGWANFSTYAKLVIVAMMILGEPTVLERIEARHPGFAQQYQQFQDRFESADRLPSAQGAFDAARTAVAPYLNPAPPAISEPSASIGQPPYSSVIPQSPTPTPRYDTSYGGWPPSINRDNYGTAQRQPLHYPQ